MDSIEHKWAHQVKHGRSGLVEGKRGNVFFDGASIFSYGRHFEIARLVVNKRGETCALLNCRTYSSSTSRHCRGARRATQYMQQFWVELEADRGNPAQWFETYRQRAADCIARADKLSDRAIVARYGELSVAHKMQNDGNTFAKFFGLRTRINLGRKFYARLVELQSRCRMG